MRHNLTDNYSFADRGTNLRITGDGFLVATPRVARTGIQIYQGAEVGRPDLDNVRVFRPPHEVFARNATSSLAHSDVTLDHPPEYLNASNWKQFSVGNTGDEVVRDGEFIRIPLIIKDATAISAIKGGKAELSVGYSADLDWTAGVTADGERYDAIQRAIRGNHIAICSQARGGSQLRIGDSSMSYKVNDAANQRRLADAYRAYDKALADAYREYDERISTAWQDGNDRQIPVADGVSDLSPFERREQAYRDHETWLQNAWRDPLPQPRNDARPARPQSRQRPAPTSAFDDREQAYAEYESRLRDAWRNRGWKEQTS